MKRLLLAVTCAMFMLTGCGAVQEGTGELPETPEFEVSHNEKSGLEAKENPYEKPELDPDFADQYIDTDAFDRSKKDAVRGIEKTEKEAEKTNQSVTDEKNKFNKQYDEMDMNADLSKDKDKAMENLKENDKSSQISSEADEIMKKITTETNTSETATESTETGNKTEKTTGAE